MPTLTKKQASFVYFKIQGFANKDAVTSAGYSSNGAKQAGTRLMANPRVRAVLKSHGYVGLDRLQTDMQRVTRNLRRVLAGGPMPYEGMRKRTYDDAIEFLYDGMNNHALTLTIRAAFAASLLPYFHRKMS